MKRSKIEMHIVFLVHRFPVDGMSTGGAGNYVANMAQTMSGFGHRVTVITEAEKKNTFILIKMMPML